MFTKLPEMEVLSLEFFNTSRVKEMSGKGFLLA